MPYKILVSAGEASGDLYASELVASIRKKLPDAEFFGCTGPRMREAGVRTVVDAASLGVVGLVEVIAHIPRIYGEFGRLASAAKSERPDLAILTDSPDFHLRLATKLHKQGIPVVYLIAPQVWAWRQSRVNRMRRDLTRLLVIFPFEAKWFREHGIPADYIGHPLPQIVRPKLSKEAFLRKHGIDGVRPKIAILPGSRTGEVARHLPALGEAALKLRQELGATLLLATAPGFAERAGPQFFKERIGGSPIQVIEGETWDVIAHADIALAASGTVTVEAALLGTPMVTFYRVTGVSWWLGRFLVNVPFYSMVNLVAGRKVVPELMQDEMTGDKLAAAVRELYEDRAALDRMRTDLAEVRSMLDTRRDPMESAAEIVLEQLRKIRA